MWNALRSDFSEFVSTVTEDTSNVLSKIDSGIGGANGDEDDAEGDTPNDGDDSVEGDDQEAEEPPPVNRADLKEIMILLRDHPGTYTEYLANEDDKENVQEYLEIFSIDAKTDEIAQVLKEHEDTVQKHFEGLCPTQVSYEEFWKRYFYRCDEERIARQLQEEGERARQARAEAIEEGIQTVTNFFGGAVKAVTNTIAPEEETTPNSQQSINFFGAKGRPPFVMNTAVSESGEDEDFQEDEEELGWGSDDDDDDLDLADERSGGEDTNTEQIEFTDKVSEDLQEQLKQAIAERDQIQQTVQMQAKEIKSLQGRLAGTAGDDTGGEVEELKLKLFEKDAELAALKARVHDDDMEDGGDKVGTLAGKLGNLPKDRLEQVKAEVFGITDNEAGWVTALEKKVRELTQTLEAKEAELATSRSQLNNDQATAQNASAAMKALEAKLKSLQTENKQLKLSAKTAEEESSSQLLQLKQEHAASEQKAASVTKQLEDAQDKVQQLTESLQQAEIATTQARATPPTPDSVSTGVKVDKPMTATKLDMDQEQAEPDDGWGDDWD